MACKFHEFRDDLTGRVHEALQIIGQSGSYSDFYKENRSFVKIYVETYTTYYRTNPEYCHILEILGQNLDVTIVTFWATFEQAELSYADFENDISLFIDKQFTQMLENKYVFRCSCLGYPANSICNGDGTCLVYCPHVCTCIEKPCACHTGPYCDRNCVYMCPPRPCKNHVFCSNTMPQWQYNVSDGLCPQSCAWRYGPLKPITTLDDCSICYSQKQNVQIMCGHTLCFSCWRKITHGVNINIASPVCPFCRTAVRKA